MDCVSGLYQCIGEANVALIGSQYLCRELACVSPGSGTGSGRSSRCRSGGIGCSDLDWYDATEGTSGVCVGDLDIANVLDVADGASAGNTSGNGEGNGEIHVDVGSTTLNHARALENIANERLLGDGSWAVAVRAGNILRGGEEGAVAELSGSRGVQNALDGAAAVRGDNMKDTRQVAARADLGESLTRKSHGLGDLGSLDLALTGRGTHTIAEWLCAAEHSGVKLSLRGIWLAFTGFTMYQSTTDLGVGARAWNHRTLDSQSSSVTTNIALEDDRLAVASNKARSRENNDQSLAEHFCKVLGKEWITSNEDEEKTVELDPEVIDD